VLALLDELEAAERIAELETREVKLPNPHAHLIWIQAGHAPDDYWDDVAAFLIAKRISAMMVQIAIRLYSPKSKTTSAIGINIAAAGKGE
jgi:hypothetical protein